MLSVICSLAASFNFNLFLSPGREPREKLALQAKGRPNTAPSWGARGERPVAAHRTQQVASAAAALYCYAVIV